MTTAIPHTRISEDSHIDENYEVGKKLGQGSFGKVYEAKHKESGMSWAIKSINKEKAGSSAIKLIEREVAILKRVKHPNIIELNEVLETPKRMYLVMEVCEGGELADALKEVKCFSEEDTKTVIKRLASAIAYLHKNDIVHRDIKLENILLSQNPKDPEDKLHIKVTDFGLSVVKGGVGHDNMMQDFCGTPMYMSPEIIDNKTYSQMCDVWAMGVIMYIMLCGYAPFRGSDDHQLYEIIKKGDVVFTDDPWPQISQEAKSCIERMLKTDPAYRMSAAEVLDHAWLTGTPHDGLTVLDLMKQYNRGSKKEGTSDDKSERAINGDSPDSIEESPSSADSTTKDTAASTSKGASNNTRKGSGGSKRSSDSRTPPNSGTKSGAQGRSAKPGGPPGSSQKTTGGPTAGTKTGATTAAGSGTKAGNTGGRAATGALNKKTTLNSNNAKVPSTNMKNQKK